METRVESRQRAADRARRRQAEALEASGAIDRELPSAARGPAAALKAARPVVARARTAEARTAQKKQSELEAAQTLPSEVYVRDPGRDSIMTCLKLHAMMLMEFVLEEYLGGVPTEWRTYIEQLVHLPVTVHTTPSRMTFDLHPNPRQPGLIERLRTACDRINQRELRRDRRRLVFRIFDPSV